MGREMTEREQDMAMLSAHVYGDTQALPKNWVVIDQYSEPKTGFAAGVYRNEVTGENVIAYRGTDDSSLTGDLGNDMQIAVGQVPSQIRDAREYYNKWTAIINDPNSRSANKGVTLIGHSLGGALAQLVALGAAENGFWHPTYTFNAPGMKGAREIQYDPDGNIISQKRWTSENLKLNMLNLEVKNFVIKDYNGGDKDVIGNYGQHIGETIYLNPVGQKPVLSDYQVNRGAAAYLVDVAGWLHSIKQFTEWRYPEGGGDSKAQTPISDLSLELFTSRISDQKLPYIFNSAPTNVSKEFFALRKDFSTGVNSLNVLLMIDQDKYKTEVA